MDDLKTLVDRVKGFLDEEEGMRLFEAAREEWTLLTGGHGAPPSIHETNPMNSRSGADGTDGLCGGKMN